VGGGDVLEWSNPQWRNFPRLSQLCLDIWWVSKSTCDSHVSYMW